MSLVYQALSITWLYQTVAMILQEEKESYSLFRQQIKDFMQSFSQKLGVKILRQ